jgi:hypothetical protein
MQLGACCRGLGARVREAVGWAHVFLVDIKVTSRKLDFRNFRPLETPLEGTRRPPPRPTAARHARDAARPRTPTNARSRQRTAAPPTSTTSVSMRKLSGALLGILGGRHASALNITLQEYADATCSRHATVCGADADVAAGADAFAWQPQCTPKLLISHVYWRCCDLCGRLSHLFGGASASSLQTAARAQALA